MRRAGALGIVVITAALCAGQSLGEVAKEQRVAKKGAESQHVYTNDDFPARSVSDEVEKPVGGIDQKPAMQVAVPQAGEKVLSSIRVEKANIATIETRVREIEKRLKERAPVGHQALVVDGRGGAYSGVCDVAADGEWNPYSAWCQEGFRLTSELEQRKMDLGKSRLLLEGFQEAARKMGYRSAVYDAD